MCRLFQIPRRKEEPKVELPYTVIYRCPYCGNEDEYVMITLNALNDQDAKEKAMKVEKFKKCINMEYFSSEFFHIKRLEYHKIGEFFHYKGIPKEEGLKYIKSIDNNGKDNN